MPLPSRSPTRQRTGAGPRPAPPAGARRPGAGGAGRRGLRTEVGEREAGPARLPEGARGGVVRRKDARARRRRGGGGDPGRTLTHRLVLLLARAPRQSALGFHSARLFPSLNVQPGRSELRRSRRERRACGKRSRGGGENGTVVLAAATATTDTAAAGSSRPRKLRTRPPRPPSAFHAARWRSDGGAGQSAVSGRPGPAGLGKSEEGRGLREVRTAAGLPVTDGQAQPMGNGEVTSSSREVRNWRSRGQEVGGGRRRAGGGAGGVLKEAPAHWSSCQGRGTRLDLPKLPMGQCHELFYCINPRGPIAILLEG